MGVGSQLMWFTMALVAIFVAIASMDGGAKVQARISRVRVPSGRWAPAREGDPWLENFCAVARVRCGDKPAMRPIGPMMPDCIDGSCGPIRHGPYFPETPRKWPASGGQLAMSEGHCGLGAVRCIVFNETREPFPNLPHAQQLNRGSCHLGSHSCIVVDDGSCGDGDSEFRCTQWNSTDPHPPDHRPMVGEGHCGLGSVRCIVVWNETRPGTPIAQRFNRGSCQYRSKHCIVIDTGVCPRNSPYCGKYDPTERPPTAMPGHWNQRCGRGSRRCGKYGKDLPASIETKPLIVPPARFNADASRKIDLLVTLGANMNGQKQTVCMRRRGGCGGKDDDEDDDAEEDYDNEDYDNYDNYDNYEN